MDLFIVVHGPPGRAVRMRTPSSQDLVLENPGVTSLAGRRIERRGTD